VGTETITDAPASEKCGSAKKAGYLIKAPKLPDQSSVEAKAL
jgi:hypothetical protein